MRRYNLSFSSCQLSRSAENALCCSCKASVCLSSWACISISIPQDPMLCASNICVSEGDVTDAMLELWFMGAHRESFDVVWKAMGGDLGVCCVTACGCDPSMIEIVFGQCSEPLAEESADEDEERPMARASCG